MNPKEVMDFLEAHEKACFDNGRISMAGAFRRARNALKEMEKENPSCIARWWNK